MSFLRLLARSGLLLVAFHVMIETSAATDPSNVSRGRKIFVKYCSGCHGAEGQGDGYRLLGPDPANLAAPATKERTDKELSRTLHEGNSNMPSWKYRLSQRDSTDVLAYIRSLNKGPTR